VSNIQLLLTSFQIAYMMVDELGQYPPPPEKDKHWEMVVPAELPYTIASAPFRGETVEAAAELLHVPKEQQKQIEAWDIVRRVSAPNLKGLLHVYDSACKLNKIPCTIYCTSRLAI
jgi:hypothetical protein